MQTATNDGVMLGYGNLNDDDIRFSQKQFDRYRHLLPAMRYALDCGAGIGRVTKQLLSKYFENCHIVEPAKNFMAKAKASLKNLRTEKGARVQVKFFHHGLQDFEFKQTYDLIWTNWTLCHLTDEDLMGFLRNAHTYLSPKGSLAKPD